MMTPHFEDILEFVRTGEKDPEMAKTLRSHPDRDELLKQARFIHRMVQVRVEGDGGRRSMAGRNLAAALSLDKPLAASEDRVFYQDALEERQAPKKKRKRIPAFDRPEAGDLGTLGGVIKGDRVELTYLPSRSVMRHWDVGDDWFTSEPALAEGIEIRGDDITIVMPDTVPVGEPLPMDLLLGMPGKPARGLKLLFMPESGPFVEFVANEEGRLEMPLPEHPGFLRIDLNDTQLIEIFIVQQSSF